MILSLKKLLLGAGAALVAGCLMVPTLTAGDFATRHIIGFSPDGAFFAFEQYGIQDGSGFSYAEIFIIDTIRDEWVAGSPIQVLVRDEQAGASVARHDVLERAATLLTNHRITEPGRLLASNPITELSADPYKVVVNPRAMMSASDLPVSFTLDEYPLPSDACAHYTDKPTKGFALTMEHPANQNVVQLHRDTDLPEGRGCPLGYRIVDVLRHTSPERQETWVVMIMVLSHGFEGPDGRFIAITRQMAIQLGG